MTRYCSKVFVLVIFLGVKINLASELTSEGLVEYYKNIAYGNDYDPSIDIIQRIKDNKFLALHAKSWICDQLNELSRNLQEAFNTTFRIPSYKRNQSATLVRLEELKRLVSNYQFSLALEHLNEIVFVGCAEVTPEGWEKVKERKSIIVSKLKYIIYLEKGDLSDLFYHLMEGYNFPPELSGIVLEYFSPYGYEQIYELKIDTLPIVSAGWSRDGTRIALGDKNNNIKILNLNNSDLLDILLNKTELDEEYICKKIPFSLVKSLYYTLSSPDKTRTTYFFKDKIIIKGFNYAF